MPKRKTNVMVKNMIQANENIDSKKKKLYSSSEIIDEEFIKKCEDNFKNSPSNIMARNAVVAIGSTIATTDSNKVNNLDHIFMNSIKKKNVKATNQGNSGRCWMFSGLNMFRHSVIEALNLENFEFSETYLFFWDKFERSNTYLNFFIENNNLSSSDEDFKFIVSDFTSDGGWWNMFTNLVNKYGLIPKSAMKETFQSDNSEDMNNILNEKLQSCANYFFKNKNLSTKKKLSIKNETLKQIYNTLVKFLGEPPKNFKWSYTNEENISNILSDITPFQFKNIIIPSVDLKDFVVLTNIPGKLKYNTMYEVKHTSNTKEGENFSFLNLQINELKKYAAKSISSGMPVWFASDVGKDFNPYHSTLDDTLCNKDIMFEPNKYSFSKSDRINFKNLQANHAMSLIGVNLDPSGNPESWQVENSWGYWDNETPGEDGFLFMSNSWFEKNVMQIVIHKNYLSRTIKHFTDKETIKLDPWDCVAPATRIIPHNPTFDYHKIFKFNNKNTK